VRRRPWACLAALREREARPVDVLPVEHLAHCGRRHEGGLQQRVGVEAAGGDERAQRLRLRSEL
jgi:hypothetical protein